MALREVIHGPRPGDVFVRRSRLRGFRRADGVLVSWADIGSAGGALAESAVAPVIAEFWPTVTFF